MRNPPQAREKWLTRRTLAWAGYDVASSVYIGLAPAVLLPLYFRDLMSGFSNPTGAWGGLAALAVLVSSFAALGAAAAARRRPRFHLLALFSAGLVAAIALLAWHPGPSLLIAALAFIAAQSFYFAAVTIYESFLPDLLPAGDRQKLSGFGWSIGYLGGIFGIVVLLVIMGAAPQSRELIERCLIAIALISAVFYAAVLWFMHRQGFAKLGEGGASLRLGSVLGALRPWRAQRRVLLLLLATMLIQIAVSVVVTFTAPILADRFGQSLRDLLWLLLLIHVLAVPLTIAWSHVMAPQWRMVATLVLLASWGAVLLLLAFGSGPWMPLVTVLVIGCSLGATASALRGFLAESVGDSNPVALFALATVAGRIAAAGGPALFAMSSFAAGEQAALMVVLLVLLCGGGLLFLYLRSEARMEEDRSHPHPAG